jgi:hypothetical protein
LCAALVLILLPLLPMRSICDVDEHGQAMFGDKLAVAT